MFQFADHDLGRNLGLSSAAILLLACLGAGIGLWYLTRCNMLDYLDRASISPRNPNERFLFACGHVWHSTDAGRGWTRLDPAGLPWGARDGYIAVDRQPDRLYLGILINTSSSLYCWDCAWRRLRPAIYVSDNGGRSWTFAYKFKRGAADSGGFLGLFVDPTQPGYVYTVIKNNDEITFYASGTAGQFWKPACVEYYDPGRTCHLPDRVLEFQTQTLKSGLEKGE